jgi:signal transduction histidine kinase
MLRRKAQARQQTLTIAVDPPDLTIVSDPQAVVEVVRRLLDNAVKFTPPGGCIGVEAALLAGAQRAPNSSPVVQITVWDTGPGLDPASLPDLAKPFTQGDASLSRSHEGIGMGLAHVCHLVPLLGGQFELAPNPGGGARFCFTLPAELTPEGWKDTVEESMRDTQ